MFFALAYRRVSDVSPYLYGVRLALNVYLEFVRKINY